MTIVDFLLARTAEDEAVARRASAVTADEWVANGSVLMHIADPGIRLAEATATVEHYGMDDAWRHAERHDPARVLAECQAKRAIIARHAEVSNDGSPDPEPWDPACTDESSAYGPTIGDPERCPELRMLAAVYADHPDYQPEWRP